MFGSGLIEKTIAYSLSFWDEHLYTQTLHFQLYPKIPFSLNTLHKQKKTHFTETPSLSISHRHRFPLSSAPLLQICATYLLPSCYPSKDCHNSSFSIASIQICCHCHRCPLVPSQALLLLSTLHKYALKKSQIYNLVLILELFWKSNGLFSLYLMKMEVVVPVADSIKDENCILGGVWWWRLLFWWRYRWRDNDNNELN